MPVRQVVFALAARAPLTNQPNLVARQLPDLGSDSVSVAWMRGSDYHPAGAGEAVTDLVSGGEMTAHLQLRIDTGLQVYVCDLHSPRQRGATENTNERLRQYVSKEAGRSAHSIANLAAIATALNARSDETLG